jgi:hypothetical protein
MSHFDDLTYVKGDIDAIGQEKVMEATHYENTDD